MASIDYDEVFDNWVVQLESAGNQDYIPKAAEYTAWGKLTNTKEKPQDWYSDEEWFQYSAPDYVAAVTYSGDDPNSLYIQQKLIEYGGNFDLKAVNDIVNDRPGELTGYSDDEWYRLVQGIYDQYSTATKQIQKQATTHPYVQYGLPNPNLRFGLKDDPTKNIVAYEPAVKFVVDKTEEYRKNLIKQGVDPATAKQRALTFSRGVKENVEAGLKSSGVTPFTVAAAQKYKAYRKK